MAKSNSRGRAPTTSEFNDLWRKLLAAADKALDGTEDPETGAHIPPTAAVMEMARKLISDVKLSPSHDVVEDARRPVRCPLDVDLRSLPGGQHRPRDTDSRTDLPEPSEPR